MGLVYAIPGFNNFLVYNNSTRIDLYRVDGLAPTYYPGLPGRGKFENVTMTWWVYRTRGFKIDYSYMLGGSKKVGGTRAINQLFLLREAEIFKEWIDDIFPEENTTITQVEIPLKEIVTYPMNFDKTIMQGSFWSDHEDWQYDLKVCYYIDLSKCKEIPVTTMKLGNKTYRDLNAST
ncbi:unnamed protein product [marine sediment metagenome]|uniref:Uncharacterized protein n=1 Tax=marine sediment metagenome TaxID=412755 RepID=X1S3Y2_9ZZZZ